MKTVDELNSLVSSWLLTLEKQGCHNLIKAGASGAIQAMVLSFGGFRFSNQHLEFNIHPKYLHRDYFYRYVQWLVTIAFSTELIKMKISDESNMVT